MISTKENNLSGGVESRHANHVDANGTSESQPMKSLASGSCAPPTQNFSTLNKYDRFTNGTGATFEKLGNHTARIVKYPGKPWMVGTFYTFGAFNYVEKLP